MRNQDPPNEIDMKPGEAMMLAIDWTESDEIPDGETIVANNNRGTTRAEIYDDTGSDVSEAMIETGSFSYEGQQIMARVYNVVSRRRYTLKFYAATSDGNVVEDQIEITGV
ncbi:hypothetical protein HTZ97_16570 [Desulfuromonas acetoxidans]|uniref:Uncharacterized protein n=1 Tax=Desulfuromonas acetoxidans (strain DSM 684 / 11070) TaxID=281689 RepID=Q1K085_DESA6|nr:hypothetical protein [Desulfuromonas acetoxidans]EAT16056.1 hypothetical protein Dace_2357 [Desulfuromonas acetoxidans DSM 684]MBF0647079.1 hypothetical protein [Desulfuromonas acetoxidans]NVD26208.1 hypothetical protein [Desulfuromonas acetoxidans]NVE18072.1 hypothetical protein [Desulfuromonas acetoxidans]